MEKITLLQRVSYKRSIKQSGSDFSLLKTVSTKNKNKHKQN